jgi:hypothetical protein
MHLTVYVPSKNTGLTGGREAGNECGGTVKACRCIGSDTLMNADPLSLLSKSLVPNHSIDL